MSELEALRQEIAALRKEVAELRAGQTIHHHYHQPQALPAPQWPGVSPLAPAVRPYYPGGPLLTTGLQGSGVSRAAGRGEHVLS